MRRALFLFENNPFAVRAMAGVLAYGTDRDFAGVWMDETERLLIGRMENAVTVCGKCHDKAELQAFLNIIGGNILLAPAGMLQERELDGWHLHRSGVVLTRPEVQEMQLNVAKSMLQNEAKSPATRDLQLNVAKNALQNVATKLPIQKTQLNVAGASPRCVAQILADSPSPWIEVGDRDALYVDLSHRLRHGCIHARMVYRDDIPAACAVTMGETAKMAVIGGVACRPEYRGQGLGRMVLQDLCDVLQSEHKEICLFTGQELIPYYSGAGFVVVDSWQEFRRKTA